MRTHPHTIQTTPNHHLNHPSSTMMRKLALVFASLALASAKKTTPAVAVTPVEDEDDHKMPKPMLKVRVLAVVCVCGTDGRTVGVDWPAAAAAAARVCRPVVWTFWNSMMGWDGRLTPPTRPYKPHPPNKRCCASPPRWPRARPSTSTSSVRAGFCVYVCVCGGCAARVGRSINNGPD